MLRKIALSIGVLALVAGTNAAFARTARITGAEVTRLEVGAIAPDFKLFGIDYQYHSLSMYPDPKAIVVGFHCNHCPVSQMNRQAWVALANAYLDQGVQVLAINPNPVDKVAADGFLQMIEVADENQYSFPYLYDETQLTAAAYGARRTDDVYVLGAADASGNRRIEYIGPLNNHDQPPNYVAEVLEALLQGREIDNREEPEFGCTIKYRTEAERQTRGVQFP